MDAKTTKPEKLVVKGNQKNGNREKNGFLKKCAKECKLLQTK